jgi:hypothetical protein
MGIERSPSSFIRFDERNDITNFPSRSVAPNSL